MGVVSVAQITGRVSINFASINRSFVLSVDWPIYVFNLVPFVSSGCFGDSSMGVAIRKELGK